MPKLHAYVFEALVVEEQVIFTFSDLCRASGANAAQVKGLVEEGLLHPVGDAPEQWQFSGPSLKLTRMALRLTHELDIGLTAAALVMELLDEVHALRARLGSGGRT